MNHKMIVIMPGNSSAINMKEILKWWLMPGFYTIQALLSALDSASSNGLDITKISRQQAAALTFPPGHPHEGVIYVEHPAAESVYFTAASFHRLVFEHKVAEAVTILMSLGATEILVEHVQGWSREFTATLQVPLGKAGVNVSGSGQNARNSSLLYEAHLRGTANPHLPDRLVWYPHEPSWQTIVDGRMQYGLSEFSLAVNYQDDYGINAKLKATAQKIDLNLGGSFEDYQATTWNMYGKFLTNP